MAMNPVRSYSDLTSGLVASIQRPVVTPAPVAPAVKEDVAPIVKETASVTKEEAVAPVPVMDATMARMPKKTAKEKRTEVIFVKVTPSIRKKFDMLCKQNNVSQADLVTYWTEIASNSK